MRDGGDDVTSNGHFPALAHPPHVLDHTCRDSRRPQRCARLLSYDPFAIALAIVVLIVLHTALSGSGALRRLLRRPFLLTLIQASYISGLIILFSPLQIFISAGAAFVVFGDERAHPDDFSRTFLTSLLAAAIYLIPMSVMGMLVAFAQTLSPRPRPPNLCPRCNYDIRASRQFGRCPECGVEISDFPRPA